MANVLNKQGDQNIPHAFGVTENKRGGFLQIVTDDNEKDQKEIEIKKRLYATYNDECIVNIENKISECNQERRGYQQFIRDCTRGLTNVVKRDKTYYRHTMKRMESALQIIKSLRRVKIAENSSSSGLGLGVFDDDAKSIKDKIEAFKIQGTLIEKQHINEFTTHIIFNKDIYSIAKRGIREQKDRRIHSGITNIPSSVITLIHGAIDPDIYKHGGDWNKQHHVIYSGDKRRTREIISFKERFIKIYMHAKRHAEVGRKRLALYNLCILTHYLLDGIISSNEYNDNMQNFYIKKIRNELLRLRKKYNLSVNTKEIDDNDIQNSILTLSNGKWHDQLGDNQLEDDIKEFAKNSYEFETNNLIEVSCFNDCIPKILGTYQIEKIARAVLNKHNVINNDNNSWSTTDKMKRALELLFCLGSIIQNACDSNNINNTDNTEADVTNVSENSDRFIDKYLSYLRSLWNWITTPKGSDKLCEEELYTESCDNSINESDSGNDLDKILLAEPFWIFESTVPYDLKLSALTDQYITDSIIQETILDYKANPDKEIRKNLKVLEEIVKS